MPGFPHRDVDTSAWGPKEWRRARLWNSVFLAAWVCFWGLLAAESFQQPDWTSIVIVSVLGGGGAIWQLVCLVRMTLWLRKTIPEGTGQ